MNIPAAVNTASSAPQIEDGLFVASFNDIEVRVVEQFKTERDKFGHADDGTRFEFMFTILDDERNPVIVDDPEDPDGRELVLRNAKSVRQMSSGEKSNSYMYLSGILTPAEMALWQESGNGDEAADAAWAAAAAKVNGRHVNVQVSHNLKGWPQIERTIGPAKPLKAAR